MVSFERKMQGAFTAKAFERRTLIGSEPSAILRIEFAKSFENLVSKGKDAKQSLEILYRYGTLKRSHFRLASLAQIRGKNTLA